MRVLGIDPGLERLGYAVLDSTRGAPSLVSYGLVTTERSDPVEKRLLVIYEDVRGIIEHYHPERIMIEQLIFARNVTTAMMVSEVRGVLLLLSAQMKLRVEEVSPSQLKRIICGNGRAPKAQIQRSVQCLLGLSEVPSPDDVADAVALALVGFART